MAIQMHPPQGSIVTVDYSKGFKEPEMVKLRLAIVLTPRIQARPQLCTIVPLSLTPPDPIMPYHKQIVIPFDMPRKWGNQERWIKGDMVNAVGFHRIDLLRMGKDLQGKRIYQTSVLPDDMLKVVRQCVLHGMGLSTLTKNL